MAWAFDQVLPPNEKVVLLALADCENGQSLACMPGQEFLAQKASMSVRTVQRMLVALEERGLIKRDRRTLESGQRTSDSYTLALRSQPHDNLSGGGGNTTTVSGGNTTTVSGTREPEERTGSTPPTPSDDTLFDLLWEAWPNKRGRKPSLARWRALSAKKKIEIKPILLAHAEAHTKFTEPRFVPMLSTWINQERWDDPVPVDETARAVPGKVAPTPWVGQFHIPRGHRAIRDETGAVIGTEPKPGYGARA